MVKNYGIHDEWKDLNKVNDIDIKSVDGVIDSIKVNGEEAGGGGGGDLSIATVSFIYNTTASNISSFIGAVALESGEMGYEHNACTYANLVIGESFKPTSLKVIMYKGEAIVEAYDGGFNVPLTVTGSAINDNGWITITGDCTFTFGS